MRGRGRDAKGGVLTFGSLYGLVYDGNDLHFIEILFNRVFNLQEKAIRLLGKMRN